MHSFTSSHASTGTRALGTSASLLASRTCRLCICASFRATFVACNSMDIRIIVDTLQCRCGFAQLRAESFKKSGKARCEALYLFLSCFLLFPCGAFQIHIYFLGIRSQNHQGDGFNTRPNYHEASHHNDDATSPILAFWTIFLMRGHFIHNLLSVDLHGLESSEKTQFWSRLRNTQESSISCRNLRGQC